MARRLAARAFVVIAVLAASTLLIAVMLVIPTLFTEPSPRRDISPGSLQGHGTEYNEAIAEHRIYELPNRGSAFYFQDELVRMRPRFRTTDATVIVGVLHTTRQDSAELGGPSFCGPAKAHESIHLITYRNDDSVFGYTIVSRSSKNAHAPHWIRDCAKMNYYDGSNHSIGEFYNFFNRLQRLGVDLQAD